MSKISVVVPVYNSPQIGATLAALEGQNIDAQEIEVLIVGPDEGGHLAQYLTQEAHPSPIEHSVGRAHKISFRHIIGTPPYSPALNRNQGMRASSGEIVCFTDADCQPKPDWLAKLLSLYANPEVQVAGGGVTFEHGTYWAYCDNVSWFSAFLATMPRGQRSHLPTLNFSLRRTVFESVGYIDERYPLPAGEDTEWTSRIREHGHQLYFEPSAIVHHAPQRTTLSALWRHGYNFGRYSPKLLAQKAGKRVQATDSIIESLLPRQPWLMALLSPLLALAAAARVVYQQRPLSLYLVGAFPGIWISKFAWCMGAVAAQKRSPLGEGIIDSH